ncbi:MAG: hypothetical protein DCF22_22700 [Leptolyngbya sp.]|nr:MAG: hypothetical protein DCF22_22700 [Leptolyngbya sp.]
MIIAKMNVTIVQTSILSVLIATPYLLACKSLNSSTSQVFSSDRVMKITFDLSIISAAGLVGSVHNQRSLSYEFCIPADEKHLAEVRALDPSVQVSRSPGRIGCTKDQYLVIGDTHQTQWRDVLMAIAGLDYVQRIDEFVGE